MDILKIVGTNGEKRMFKLFDIQKHISFNSGIQFKVKTIDIIKINGYNELKCPCKGQLISPLLVINNINPFCTYCGLEYEIEKNFGVYIHP